MSVTQTLKLTYESSDAGTYDTVSQQKWNKMQQKCQKVNAAFTRCRKNVVSLLFSQHKNDT